MRLAGLCQFYWRTCFIFILKFYHIKFRSGIPKTSTKSKILALYKANISKTVISRSLICQLELKISSTKAFQKCIAWDGSPPPGGVPIRKMCIFKQRPDISRRSAWKFQWRYRALSRTWISPVLVAISLGVSHRGGGKMVFWTICPRRSFCDLRHIQLPTGSSSSAAHVRQAKPVFQMVIRREHPAVVDQIFVENCEFFILRHR